MDETRRLDGLLRRHAEAEDVVVDLGQELRLAMAADLERTALGVLAECYIADDLGAFLEFWRANPGFSFLAVATARGTPEQLDILANALTRPFTGTPEDFGSTYAAVLPLYFQPAGNYGWPAYLDCFQGLPNKVIVGGGYTDPYGQPLWGEQLAATTMSGPNAWICSAVASTFVRTGTPISPIWGQR